METFKLSAIIHSAIIQRAIIQSAIVPSAIIYNTIIYSAIIHNAIILNAIIISVIIISAIIGSAINQIQWRTLKDNFPIAILAFTKIFHLQLSYVRVNIMQLYNLQSPIEI